jgi:hypothetical protein
MVRELSSEGIQQVRRWGRAFVTLTRRKSPERTVDFVGLTAHYTVRPPLITAQKLDVPTRGMDEELAYLMKVMPPTLPRTDSVVKPGA